MEENPADHPGIPLEQYHKLGNKTLMIFVLQRISAAFVLLLVAIVLFAIQGASFITQAPIANLSQYVGIAAEACFLLFAFFFLISFLIAWLTYVNYKFALSENSLKITRGIFNKEDIAIPYRQIQDVDIDRDLAFRMMGLSHIIILTAGHEDQPGSHDDPGERGQSEGVLPALDYDLAEWLQTELLKRTDVQKVIEVKS